MDHDWHALLTTATGDFARILDEVDSEAAVPSCPGWTVAALVDHLGGVHQWARHAVVARSPDGQAEPAPSDPSALADWYAGHARALLDSLTAAGDADEAWTFGTERTAGWWWRRQTHETLMHTRDLLEAAGRVEEWRIDPALAWDGVHEVATEFYPRQVRLGRTDPLPRTLVLVATDLPDADPVRIGAAEDVVELPVTAADGLLLLWHRAVSTDPAAAPLLAAPIAP